MKRERVPVEQGVNAPFCVRPRQEWKDVGTIFRLYEFGMTEDGKLCLLWKGVEYVNEHERETFRLMKVLWTDTSGHEEAPERRGRKR